MSREPISLRRAQAADALSLGVLATQVFLDTYAIEGIRDVLAREVRKAFSTEALAAIIADEARRLVAVAECAGHLVGFAQLTLGTPQALVDTPRPAELDRLYVQEPFTGRRLGARLLAWAEHEAAARGASALWLTPWVHNARALHFYAREGYVDVGPTWFEMEGERHENRVLLKPLDAAAGAPR